MSHTPQEQEVFDEVVDKPKTGQSFSKKFHLKHIYRAGAIVWLKSQGKDYYAVFRSLTRPNRGTQLPGGRIERKENPAQAILREVAEETGIESKIVCPLGMIYFENENDNYSNLQMYYIVRPVFPLNVFKKWKYTDKDMTRQELECWFVPIDKDPEFLSAGQSEVVHMFRQWLEEHKPKKTKQVNKPSYSKKNNSQPKPVNLNNKKSFNPKNDYHPINKLPTEDEIKAKFGINSSGELIELV